MLKKRKEVEVAEEVIEAEEVTGEETVSEAQVVDNTIATDKLARAVEVARQELQFIGDFAVVGYKDKGNVSEISLNGVDFNLVITIKDNAKFGI